MTSKQKPMALVCLGPVSRLEWYEQMPDRVVHRTIEFPVTTEEKPQESGGPAPVV